MKEKLKLNGLGNSNTNYFLEEKAFWFLNGQKFTVTKCIGKLHGVEELISFEVPSKSGNENFNLY